MTPPQSPDLLEPLTGTVVPPQVTASKASVVMAVPQASAGAARVLSRTAEGGLPGPKPELLEP